MSDRARRRLVREATKAPTTSLKELRASVAQMGDCASNNCYLFTSWSYVGEWQRENDCWKMLTWNLAWNLPKGMWEIPSELKKKSFFGVMRHKLSFLPIRLHMFGKHKTLHITTGNCKGTNTREKIYLSCQERIIAVFRYTSLIGTYPHRPSAVIAAKGASTSYSPEVGVYSCSHLLYLL